MIHVPVATGSFSRCCARPNNFITTLRSPHPPPTPRQLACCGMILYGLSTGHHTGFRIHYINSTCVKIQISFYEPGDQSTSNPNGFGMRAYFLQHIIEHCL